MLKAIETSGTDLAKTLHLDDDATLDDVLHHACQAIPEPSGQHHEPLPWLTIVRNHDGQPLANYLNQAATLINERVQDLTGETITARPAWMTALGAAPKDPTERAEWLRHLSIVAAYRDQQQITTNDPHQLLGPYAEPGRPEHTAYWNAVDSILAARRLAGLDHDTGPRELDPARAQLAADLYSSLPDHDRAAVHRAVAERQGDLWFGDQFTIDDDTILKPTHAHALDEVLVEQGHLTALEPDAIRRAHGEDGHRRQPAVEERPFETELVRRRTAQQDAERAARLERAQRARMRDQARREKQQRRVQPRRHQTQDIQAAPPLQPPSQQQTQRHERRFG
jgi:hypothetical protein